ncbi:MAG: hypothetical protein ACRDRH_03680 [Pseudonocardia sp.]
MPRWPAPKPGVIPLRPLGVGEIVDSAIAYIRANPAATLGISAVVVTITQLLQLPAQYLYLDGLQGLAANSDQVPSLDDTTEAISGGLTIGVLGGFLSAIVVTLLTGLLIVVLNSAVLGRKLSLGEAWATTRPRLAGLLGLTLLTGLLIAAVVFIGFVPVALAVVAGAPTGITVTLGLVLIPAGLCLAVFLWVSWSMVTPAYMLEGIPVRAVFGRSYRLVGPQWWRVFGILLLATLLATVISAILAVPFSFAGAALQEIVSGDDLVGPGLISLGIGAVGTILASTLSAPFSAGVTGLLYFDQRIRREALDIELARAAQPGSWPPGPGGPGWGPPGPGGVG